MSRTERIELRLSPDEHAAWKGAAKQEERTLSDWIRLRVNTSLRDKPEGVTLPAWPTALPPEPIPVREWPEKTILMSEPLPERMSSEMPEHIELTPGGEWPEKTEVIRGGDTVHVEIPMRLTPGGDAERDEIVLPAFEVGTSVGTSVEGGGLLPVPATPDEHQDSPNTAPPSTSSCRMEAFHVKGRFCKVCSKVPL